MRRSFACVVATARANTRTVDAGDRMTIQSTTIRSGQQSRLKWRTWLFGSGASGSGEGWNFEPCDGSSPFDKGPQGRCRSQSWGIAETWRG